MMDSLQNRLQVTGYRLGGQIYVGRGTWDVGRGINSLLDTSKAIYRRHYTTTQLRGPLVLICSILLLLTCSTSVAEEAYIYDNRGKRDPFVPLVGVKVNIADSLEDVMNIDDVYLQGVAIDSKGARVAILNGEMIKEGDTSGRVALKKIAENSVTLSIDNDEYTINMYEEDKGGR